MLNCRSLRRLNCMFSYFRPSLRRENIKFLYGSRSFAERGIRKYRDDKYAICDVFENFLLG